MVPVAKEKSAIKLQHILQHRSKVLAFGLREAVNHRADGAPKPVDDRSAALHKSILSSANAFSIGLSQSRRGQKAPTASIN